MKRANWQNAQPQPRQKVDKEQTHELTRDTLQAAIRYFERATPTDKLLMGSRKSGQLEGVMSERAITDRVRVLGEAVGLEGNVGLGSPF